MSPRDAASAVGWMALHGAWQAAAVALLLAAALRWMDPRAAQARYRAACAALACAVLLPAATLVFARMDVGVTMGSASASARSTALPVMEAAPRVLAWAGALWMAGVAASLARLALAWRETRRLRREDVHPAPAAWEEALRRLAARTGVRTPVALRVSARVDVPMVAGIRRPTILLPRAVADALGAGQAEAVLAHELVHVRRGDALANLLQLAAEALFIRHPAVRWISAQARREREHRCDAAVVALGADAVVYARALATLEQLRPGRRLALAAADGELLDRVRRLVAPAEARGGRPLRAAGTAAAGMLAIALAACGAAQRTRPLLNAPTPPLMTVRATDPAGDFTLGVRGGRVVSATFAGVPVGRDRLVQVRDSVTVLSEGGEPRLGVRLLPDGIRWTPRAPAR
jgi:beta-lactamase regulating signal transducer with metallopeptidase domain